VPDMPLISAYTLYLAGLLSFNYKMMQSNAFCGKFTPLDLAYLAILKVNCKYTPVNGYVVFSKRGAIFCKSAKISGMAFPCRLGCEETQLYQKAYFFHLILAKVLIYARVQSKSLYGDDYERTDLNIQKQVIISISLRVGKRRNLLISSQFPP